MSLTNRLRCDVPADWVNDFSQCLFEWQGLGAGALAILAAVIGGGFLWGQITQADRHRQDEIERRHTASRVALPLVLARVSSLTQQIADGVASEIEALRRDESVAVAGPLVIMHTSTTAFPPIQLDESVVGSFQQFVETLDDPAEVRHVAELMGSLQILLARYSSFDFKQAAVENSLQGLLLDAGKVRMLNNRLYNYGRFVEDDSFSVIGSMEYGDAWDEILREAQALIFSRRNTEVFLGPLQERVTRYKGQGSSPWIEKFEP